MEMQIKRRNRTAVVFDSGIGGLNLLSACASRVTDIDYFFISDNRNVPYGNRTGEEIYILVQRALEGVEELNPAALVIACNTVTARCIEVLRKRYSFPVVGIQPAVKQAAKIGGKCLVLATEATVESPSFLNLIATQLPPEMQTQTEIAGCKHLAEYIEKNIFSLPKLLPRGLLPEVKADSVVLGCTHYAFVKKQIEEYYNCSVFDGIEGTATHFAEIVVTGDNYCPLLGKTDHLSDIKPKITFLRGNNAKNRAFFEKMFAKVGNVD